jgi:hypothetical protein
VFYTKTNVSDPLLLSRWILKSNSSDGAYLHFYVVDSQDIEGLLAPAS